MGDEGPPEGVALPCTSYTVWLGKYASTAELDRHFCRACKGRSEFATVMCEEEQMSELKRSDLMVWPGCVQASTVHLLTRAWYGGEVDLEDPFERLLALAHPWYGEREPRAAPKEILAFMDELERASRGCAPKNSEDETAFSRSYAEHFHHDYPVLNLGYMPEYTLDRHPHRWHIECAGGWLMRSVEMGGASNTESEWSEDGRGVLRDESLGFGFGSEDSIAEPVADACALFLNLETCSSALEWSLEIEGCTEECGGGADGRAVYDCSHRILATSWDFTACPYVYTRSAKGAPWVERGEVLRELRSPELEATQSLDVGGEGTDCATGVLTVRMAELKEETTYLDAVWVELGGEQLAPRSCAEGPSRAWCADDGRYARLEQGDTLDFEFEVPEALRLGCSGARLWANGYYVPH